MIANLEAATATIGSAGAQPKKSLRSGTGALTPDISAPAATPSPVRKHSQHQRDTKNDG